MRYVEVKLIIKENRFKKIFPMLSKYLNKKKPDIRLIEINNYSWLTDEYYERLKQ